MQRYGKEFFDQVAAGSLRSAREIVPLVTELVQPKSVVDVGCGLGTWLSVFREHGINDILGVDADYLDRKLLQIPEDRFLPFDLGKPLYLDRTFDLVVSLEVAEHLPKVCARNFIESLTRLGPVVLFSAAVPHQVGRYHVNEQWPEYWAKYFDERNFQVIDCLRKRVWDNKNVDWWYAQNMLLFVRSDFLRGHHVMRSEAEATSRSQLSIVHPGCYLAALDPKNVSIRKLVAMLPRSLARFARRTAGRLYRRNSS